MAKAITLVQAKKYMGVSADTDDDMIELFIEQATTEMEKFAGRHLVGVTITETLSGNSECLLFLNEPAESVTSVAIDSTRTFGGAGIIDASNYFVEGATLEYIEGTWDWGQRNIQAIYDAGFATVPDDIQGWCMIEVGRRYSSMKRARKAMDIIDDINIEDVRTKFQTVTGLTEDVQNGLTNGYMNPRA
jgi:hypothetical protein